jgi:hypothetical protein
MTKQQKTTRMIVLMGLFIALSVIGGYIKIPNPVTSSIALDSMPAFLATLVLGGGPGAIVGFLGHLVSAAIGGFPLSLPIHLIIGVQMVIVMLVFGWAARKFNVAVAVIVGIILNGVVAPASFIPLPGMGVPFFVGSVGFLLLASAVNAVVAGIIYHYIRDIEYIKAIQGE